MTAVDFQALSPLLVLSGGAVVLMLQIAFWRRIGVTTILTTHDERSVVPKPGRHFVSYFQGVSSVIAVSKMGQANRFQCPRHVTLDRAGRREVAALRLADGSLDVRIGQGWLTRQQTIERGAQSVDVRRGV